MTTLEEFVTGVLEGDRTTLSRAVTLIESRRSDHQHLAAQLIAELGKHPTSAQRIGITGVPGVGKSTFIDQFGMNLIEQGHRVAVLAVDPTSQRTGGSILGDKTRMQRLAVSPEAFIRPSPAGATLGGVTRSTREAMLLCEAAGFDVVLVETVGVGQSETIVSEMVDFFLVLMLSGAGDELQGIKKGVLELADAVAVNKADGDNSLRAAQAAAEYRHALRLMAPESPNWSPPVVTCSGLTNEGLAELWQIIQQQREVFEASGERVSRRRTQQVRWMWSMIHDRLDDAFRSDPQVSALMADAIAEVEAGTLGATSAAEQLTSAFLEGSSQKERTRE
ncbi:MAG TPA: methylmalonyl Co-A mutase-associated GTPase MeaB [Acidimicrobiaceae bacterium]|nr:methylmalonyl Co-A mutase-associated GTPase MeaB [Acidimicrobiaceae bacterium]